METFIKIIINLSLIFGSGYCAKEILLDIEKLTTKRIKRDFHHQKGLPENSLAQNYLFDDLKDKNTNNIDIINSIIYPYF